MKTLMTTFSSTVTLLMLLISGQSQANDLIYRHGFENSVLVSGVATGNTSSGMVLHLETNGSMEDLPVNASGAFSFFVAATPGASYEVTISSLPNQPSHQSCTLAQASGQVPPGGVNDITVSCDNTLWRWNVMDWDEGGWQ